MPPRCLLERRPRTEQARFAPGRRNQLQANWQPILRQPAGQRQRRKTGQVERRGVARQQPSQFEASFPSIGGAVIGVVGRSKTSNRSKNRSNARRTKLWVLRAWI